MDFNNIFKFRKIYKCYENMTGNVNGIIYV